MQTAKKILVTRPAHQSDNLCKLITQQNWQPIRFPVIEIQVRALSTLEITRLENINSYRYVFFVSVNAVNFVLQVLNGKIKKFQQVTCIAIGKATYEALENLGISGILIPEQGFNSEAVLALPELQTLAGESCLIIRGEGGRELLADSLIQRGATVDYLEVYKRVLPVCDGQLIEEYITKNELTAIVIYSGDALKKLMRLLTKDITRKDLLSIMLVVISQRVYVLAKEIGFKTVIIADQASDSAMINALLNGEQSGRNN